MADAAAGRPHGSRHPATAAKGARGRPGSGLARADRRSPGWRRSPWPWSWSRRTWRTNWRCGSASSWHARTNSPRARRRSALPALAWLGGAAPFVLAALLAGAVVVLVQTRFLLSGKALRVDFSRVSPRAGLKRLLGAGQPGRGRQVAGQGRRARHRRCGGCCWPTCRGLMLAPFGDPSQLLARAAGPVLHVMLVVLAAQAAIAVLDYAWVHAAPRRAACA